MSEILVKDYAALVCLYTKAMKAFCRVNPFIQGENDFTWSYAMSHVNSFLKYLMNIMISKWINRMSNVKKVINI